MKAYEVANRVLARMGARIAVTANVHDHAELDTGLFKVVCTLTTDKADADAVRHAVAAALGNELSVVEGSFRVVPSAAVPAVVGFVRANNVSKPYTEEAASRMTVVAKNILMDKDDESLWEVRSAAGSKYLVRQVGDDLGQLVQLARVRAFNVPKLSQLVTSSFGQHEYVAYVDKTTQTLKHGFVLGAVECEGDEDDLAVYSDIGDEIVIDPDTVVESAFVGDALKEIAAEKQIDLPANLNSREGMKSYYEAMFRYAPEYVTMLNGIIDQHAVA